MFCLLTLPFRIFFGILFAVLLLPLGLLVIPFLLLRALFKLVLFVLIAPIVVIAAIAAIVIGVGAIFVALLLPLLPFALLALLVWALVRASQPAYAR